MIKIIEAMYDLANEDDRVNDKSPDKRVELIMQRLNKEKDGKDLLSSLVVDLLRLDVVLRNEFIDGCLRDELLRKILAPNTTLPSNDNTSTTG